jgi:hypothetical protein
MSPSIKFRIDGDSAEGRKAVRDMVAALKQLGSTAETEGKKLEGVGKSTGNLARLTKDALRTVAVGVAAAVGVNAFAQLAADSLEHAKAIGKLAQQTGIATETLSVYAEQARLADVSQEELGRSLNKLAVTLADIQQGNLAAAGSFRAIGLDAKELAGLPLDQAFLRIANALEQYRDGANKSAVVQDIFGARAAKLIPLLQSLAGEGFARATEEATRFGVVVREQDVRAAEELERAMNALKSQVRGVAGEFAQGLAPALTRVADAASELAGDGGPSIARRVGAWLGVLTKAATGIIETIAVHLDPRKTFFQKGQAQNAIWQRLFGTPADVAAAAGPARDAAVAQLQLTIDALKQAGQDVEAVDTSQLSTEAIEAKTKELGQRLKRIIQLEAADQLQIWKALSDARLAALDAELARVRARGQVLTATLTATFDQGQSSLRDFFTGRRAALEQEGQAEGTAARQRAAELQRAFEQVSAIRADGPEAIQARTAAENARNQVIVLGLQLEERRLALQEEERQKAEELNRTRLDFTRSLAEEEGRVRDAALVGLDQQVEAFRKALLQTGVDAEEAHRQVLRFQDAGQARIDLDELQRQAGAITSAIATNEARLQNQVNAGLITADQATIRQNQFIAAQKDGVAGLQALFEAMRETATDPQIIAALDAQIAALQGIQVAAEGAQNQLEAFGTEGLQVAGQALGDFFRDSITGAKSFGEAFRSLVLDVIKGLGDIALKILETQAITALAGALGLPIPEGGFHFAQGGPVPGSGKRDSVRAMLTPGEYVLTPKMADALGGVGFLERLRRMLRTGPGPLRQGGLSFFASGGPVGPAGGGGTEVVRVELSLEEGIVARQITSREGSRAVVEVLGKNKNAVKETTR